MWTPATRQQHSRPVTRYQTDLTDAEENWLSGAQLVEQRLGLLQIECVEALDEPTVD